MLLIAHYDRRHLDTVRKLVEVWAPPNENDTEACARCVAKASGFGIDEPLDLHDYACLRPEDRVIRAYREHQSHYAIEIVFPEGPVSRYCIEFTERGPRLQTGTPASEPADMLHRIAASALLDWVEHRKSYFYVRTYSRRHSILYRLERNKSTSTCPLRIAGPADALHAMLRKARRWLPRPSWAVSCRASVPFTELFWHSKRLGHTV